MIQLDNVIYKETSYDIKDSIARDDIDKTKDLIVQLQSFLGFDSDQVLGLCVDYKNKTFERLSGARGLSAGSDFDKFSMYGGRKRCNVADDGTVNAYYGDEGYIEDGSNGQVMVYQPKFYYMVKPISLEKQETGKGYHLRKANYYISEVPLSGFKLHPLFKNANGEEVDYVLKSAYEGCIYDTSEGAYILDDDTFDISDDKLSSISGAHPCSGSNKKLLTLVNSEKLSQNRGENWHEINVQDVSCEQLLMIVEYGTMNLQSVLSEGVTKITDASSTNCASFTGSTSDLGNTSGTASVTTDYLGVSRTGVGEISFSYRGVENFYGNIYAQETGVIFYGDGSMNGGELYIHKNLLVEDGDPVLGNYIASGFTISNANGFISAVGYSPIFDWLFFASETNGDSSLPVGDYQYDKSNLSGYCYSRVGGCWSYNNYAGSFCRSVNTLKDANYRTTGARLLYIPSKK